MRKVPKGILQGSPLLLILFLVYSAGLLKAYEDKANRTTGIGFVDNANVLAYGPTTKGNYKALKRVYGKLLV